MWMRRWGRDLWRTLDKRAWSSPTATEEKVSYWAFNILISKAWLREWILAKKFPPKDANRFPRIGLLFKTLWISKKKLRESTKKYSTYPWHASQTVDQARHVLCLRLFDELDSRWEVHAQVLRPMIGDRNLQIFYFSSLFEHVWQGRHIQDEANVVLLDLGDVLAVSSIAQEKSGKNLDWLAAIRLQWIVGSTLAVGRLCGAATGWVRCRNAKRSANRNKKLLHVCIVHVNRGMNHVENHFIFNSYEWIEITRNERKTRETRRTHESRRCRFRVHCRM